MKNWLTPLLVAVSLFALAACTSTSAIISNGIKIELTLIERGSDGTVQVSWRVKNPNIVAYLVDQYVHKITLDGVLIGTVGEKVRIGVAPQTTVERTNVLVPASPQIADRLRQLAAKGSASYQVDSTVYLLIYDDEISKSSLTGSGSVPVIAK